jgi:hypothetical protein
MDEYPTKTHKHTDIEEMKILIQGLTRCNSKSIGGLDKLLRS